MGADSAHYPGGVYLSTSENGLHFQGAGFAGFTGEPGIVQDEAGVFHARIIEPASGPRLAHLPADLA